MRLGLALLVALTAAALAPGAQAAQQCGTKVRRRRRPRQAAPLRPAPVIAVERATRRYAVAQGRRRLDAAGEAHARMYADPRTQA
jgi:hypothetical protein